MIRLEIVVIVLFVSAYCIGHSEEVLNLSDTIVYTAEAQAPEEPKEILIGVTINWTPDRINEEIEKKAEEYAVDANTMRKVIQCESHGSTTIQSRYKRPDGTREQSFGLAQIHLPDHPHVSLEEAIDPSFAIDFLAKHLAQGKGRLWTCYRNLKS